MQKVLLIAALVAFSNAQFILSDILDVQSDFYDLNVYLKADIGYQTIYGAGASTTQVTQAYSLNFYSYFKVFVVEQVAQAYTNELEITFYPFNIYPYKQNIAINRFDNGGTFGMTFLG